MYIFAYICIHIWIYTYVSLLVYINSGIETSQVQVKGKISTFYTLSIFNTMYRFWGVDF